MKLTQDGQITANILATVLKLKKDGTVGMSLDNLRQITPTTGITLTPIQYRDAFARIAKTKFASFAKDSCHE